ncbi:MAG: response regulator, partial [Pseudomonadota bacterium]
MVIDDSKTIRRTAESLLVEAGAKVVTASDG